MLACLDMAPLKDTDLYMLYHIANASIEGWIQSIGHNPTQSKICLNPLKLEGWNLFNPVLGSGQCLFILLQTKHNSKNTA